MLRLIKTVGGQGGSPHRCHSCGGNHFVKSGMAWVCATCSSYFPAELKKTDSLLGLRQNLDFLTAKHRELKQMIKELEELVK